MDTTPNNDVSDLINYEDAELGVLNESSDNENPGFSPTHQRNQSRTIHPTIKSRNRNGRGNNDNNGIRNNMNDNTSINDRP